MAIGKLGRADHERHVNPVGAQLYDCAARRALHDINLDVGMVFARGTAQSTGEEATRDQSVDADRNRATTSADRYSPMAKEAWATKLRNRESHGFGVNDAATPAPNPGCKMRNGARMLPMPTISAGTSVG